MIVSNILDELRRKEIVVDFAPSKLKSGYGEQCLYVLNNLADLALIADGFSWQRFFFLIISILSAFIS